MRLIGQRLILGACVSLLVACTPIQAPPAPQAEEDSNPGWVEGFESEDVYANEAVYITEELVPGEGEGQAGGNPEGPFPVTEYVQNQVILTGRLADIDAVVAQVGENVPGLQPIPELAIIGPVAGDIYAVVYAFDAQANSAREGTEKIRAVAAELQLPVFVDPNYVAGIAEAHAATAVCANPLSGEASPLSGEASPFSLPPNTPTSAMVPAFWNQWAFGPSGPSQGGINLVAGGVRRSLPTGAGRTIYILDTSPFTRTGTYSFGPPVWFSPALTLGVSHPVANTLTSAGASSVCGLADHGLFVAGLAYAVAPEATLRLVRVLNGQGKGDLGGILTVLFALTQAIPANSVVNMSFGFVPIPAPPSTPSLNQACADLAEELGVDMDDDCQDIGALYTAWQDAAVSPATAKNVLENIQAPMLALLVGELQQQNVVMVAAAGNKSQANQALAPQLPAAYAASKPALLSTVAGTSQRARAHYSNDGVIMAPGGGDNTPVNCLAATSAAPLPNCWTSADDFVVSLILRQQPTPRFTFGYWVGTSFATPLVGGMAAVKSGATATATTSTVKASVCLSSSSLPPAVPHRPAICF